ncbi:G-protein coupled receptor 1 [Mucuna pruriens]|uniref:G-protein coupled receptor 1 n=1 Tax=Mucuna pruriens TaxID=157652 RepID=A0A371FQP1_MUCPR|nr:G-protein coupled receptor 1 [Mucuna pruriens]
MATSVAVSGALTAHDRRILTAVNSAASSLSLAGSGFIVVCYFLFKELRKFSFKLVFYLALSDMLCSFFSIIGDPSKGFFCYAQGYSTHFFCVASFLWTTTIAFTLHRTVVKHKTDVEELEGMFHLYVWGTSLLCAPLVMTIDILVPGAGLKQVVHFVTFYMPLWGAILYNGFTYFQVIRMLNNATRMAVGMSGQAFVSDTRDNMRALNRWGYYPLILIGSWAFGTINRIHDFFYPNHQIFWLTFLDVGTAALMGLFNSIAYGLNSSVRRAICERLDKFWPERLYRWLPNNLKYKNLQQESELESHYKALSTSTRIIKDKRSVVPLVPEEEITESETHHNGQKHPSIEGHDRQHQQVPDRRVHPEQNRLRELSPKLGITAGDTPPQKRGTDLRHRRRGPPLGGDELEANPAILEVLVEGGNEEAGE